ncbi:amino acid permease [Candidatus Poribacteria bacterium]|nr:amino acid permease [Candidatus Poribacteria bacterium]OUT58289.1 MAG: amino acid permease [bacterium TMED15]
MKKQPENTQKFNTFGGVFTPCTLTILGVIMFLRFGHVVGQTGIIQAVMIVALSKAITLLTTLSLSAIATNTEVKGGGAYFLISRSLGVEFGAAIGIVFFLAQAISVAMYVFGFAEALMGAFGNYLNFSLGTISTVVNLLVFVSVMIGAGWTIKLQYGILGILITSLVSFYVGGLLNFNLTTLQDNITSNYQPNSGFFPMFALFFPAVTGIMAGANMSGDLKEPGRSIPKGTLWSVAVTAVVYLSQVIIFAGSRPSAELIRNNLIIKEISVYSPLITMGVFAATLSSALSSMMGSPRILQALARDGIIHQIRLFAAGSGQNNEPRRAIILTFFISQICIWLGDLNKIAPIIAMFFMITYGTLNLATFLESWARNPSYRPRFRWSHWSTAGLGTIACYGVMFLFNWLAAVISVAAIGLIYWWVSRRQLRAKWGDVRSGFAFEQARSSLLRLEDERYHPKNWRPTILAFSGNVSTRKHLAVYGHWLEAGRGILTLAHVITGDVDKLRERQERQERIMRRQIHDAGLGAFPAVIVSHEYADGVKALVQCHGIGGLRANTIMLGWPHDLEQFTPFLQLLRELGEFDRSLIVFKRNELSDQQSDNELVTSTDWMNANSFPEITSNNSPIDVWWNGSKNGAKMVLLAHLLCQNPHWRSHEIRLLRVITSESGLDEATNHLHSLIDVARIEATPVVLVGDDPVALIRETSGNSSVVFLGFEPPTKDDENDFRQGIEYMTGNFQTTILVSSADDVELNV